MVFVECLQVLADRVLVVERFRHEHCHCVWHAQSRHCEEFKYIVERGTVAHTGLYDWADILDVAESGRRQNAFARLHPCSVATYCVDFTVVGQQTERLGKAPCGERVGAET